MSSLLSILGRHRLTSTSPIPIPLPTHHHHPNQVCHKIEQYSKCCNQSIPSSLTATKLQAVLTVAKKIAAEPKIAVPPSVLHARRRLTTNPHISRAIVKIKRRVELNTFRMASPRSRTVWEGDKAVKTKKADASAKGPRTKTISRASVLEG